MNNKFEVSAYLDDFGVGLVGVLATATGQSPEQVRTMALQRGLADTLKEVLTTREFSRSLTAWATNSK